MKQSIIIFLGVVCIGLLSIILYELVNTVDVTEIIQEKYKEIQRPEPTCGEGTEEIRGICYPSRSRSV